MDWEGITIHSIVLRHQETHVEMEGTSLKNQFPRHESGYKKEKGLQQQEKKKMTTTYDDDGVNVTIIAKELGNMVGKKSLQEGHYVKRMGI